MREVRHVVGGLTLRYGVPARVEKNFRESAILKEICFLVVILG